LVSSQRFPHLWKKLWKILGISFKAQLPGLFLRGFSAGEAANACKSGLPRIAVRVKGRKTAKDRGRKPAEPRFC
jgi:hypothetical protein